MKEVTLTELKSIMNSEDIRTQTLAAIERGKEMRRNKEAEDIEREKQRHLKAQEWVKAKLKLIPELAKSAAAEGKFRCVVASTLECSGIVRNGLQNCNTHNPKWHTKGFGLNYHLLEEELKTWNKFALNVVYRWNDDDDVWHDFELKW